MSRKTFAALTLVAALFLAVGLFQRVAQACNMGDPTCDARPGSLAPSVEPADLGQAVVPCEMSDPTCG